MNQSSRALLDRLAVSLESHVPQRVAEPGVRAAAVAVAIAPATHGDPEILFLKRAVHPRDPWSGQIALPGGRHDEMDASLADTAVREAWEEAGLDLSAARLLGELDDVYPRTPVLPPVFVRPFVFALPARPAIRLNHESTLGLWAGISELASTRSVITLSRHQRIATFPGFRVGSHVIWGMTERILHSLMDLVDHK